MLAARILGRKEVGLGSILEAEFNIQVDKRHQRANWGQRPLPGFLLDYARQDTHYLIPLKKKLEQPAEGERSAAAGAGGFPAPVPGGSQPREWEDRLLAGERRPSALTPAGGGAAGAVHIPG